MNGVSGLVAVLLREVDEAPVAPEALGSVGSLALALAHAPLGAIKAHPSRLAVTAIRPGAAHAALQGRHASPTIGGIGRAEVA